MRGRQIVFSSDAERGAMRWGDLGVDIVIEATGKSQTRAELESHLEAGAKPRRPLCPACTWTHQIRLS